MPVPRSLALFLSLLLVGLVLAQSSTNSSATPSQTPTGVFTSLQTTTFTSTATTLAGSQNVTLTTVITSVFNATITPTPTTSSLIAAAATNTSTPTPPPIVLDTRIDPGFGVLGGVLILTGLPSAFWGHKNRWSSFFLIGFYTFALVCFSLIMKFGILTSINPPSTALRGVFVLACGVAGVAGGGVAIFFWHQAKYFIGAWGGFALALWIQCLREGGIIRPIGLRWIFYIGLAVIGFTLCTIPKIHYQVLLASTAFVGSSVFVLGVDCFTTAGLKEFYVWNLGFQALFTKFTSAGIQFPINQMIEVELGLIGAVALMGAAVQWRILTVLQIKMRQITEEQKRRDAELEAQATARFATTAKEMVAWEKDHGKHGSNISDLPLMMRDKDQSPLSADASHVTLVQPGERARRHSNLSDFVAATPEMEDEFGRPKDRRQTIGVLPPMDFGTEIEREIPSDFVTTETDKKDKPTPQELEVIKRKEALKAEIMDIRKSIEALSERSASRNSRNRSFDSRRTLSQELSAAVRPPRPERPRARVNSMDMSTLNNNALGSSIQRPSSVPTRDEWNEYVRDRRLYRPPSGASPPPGLRSPQPVPASQLATIPPAVSDALQKRKQHEQALALEFGQYRKGGEDPFRNSVLRSPDLSAHVPAGVTILPPRKTDSAHQKPNALKTKTYEELTARHREKLRDLQAPLSLAEREQAKLNAARSRWEHSKAVEKQVMAKREADATKGLKEGSSGGSGDSPDGKRERVRTRDELASRRQSRMKVQDWQRYQDMEATKNQVRAERPGRPTSVPFPARTRESRPPQRLSTVLPQ